MKRFLASVLALFCLAGTLSGCGNWLDGSYSSIVPHLAGSNKNNQEVTVASNYVQLRQALVKLVESGRQSGIISVADFDAETLRSFMNMAIDYVRINNAVGAYALDTVSYELGTNAGVQAVAVSITYTHSRSEILQIRQVDDMTAAINLILSNLENCTSGIVLKVEEYDETDLVQLIEDHADANPDKVMELPQVSAVLYPERGKERVIEVSFTYQSNRDDLRAIKEKVKPFFPAAEVYVRETPDERGKYSQLYSFLMERFSSYTVQTSLTPAYSLLMYGVGDSEACANVYAAMCRQAGLSCLVVSGTRNGEAWYWNIISHDGQTFHVDLLRCVSAGGFRERLTDEMTEYVWDYSAYEAESPKQ